MSTTHANILYYDCSVINNSDDETDAIINDSRGNAIIKIPENWEMSVIRFDLTTSLIPPSTIDMFPGAVLGVLSPSLLSFTMRFAGLDTQVFVQNDTLGQIFGIDRLLDQMNVALLTIHTGLIAPASSTPPILAFNPLTQLITMYYESVYSTVGDIELWCNFPTRQKLSALPIETFAGFNRPLGKDFRLCFTCGSTKNEPLVRDGLPFITNVIPNPMLSVSQEAIVMSAWNTIRSIKLITNSIPIKSELQPSSILLLDQGNFSVSESAVISDFLMMGIDNPISDRISIEYLPSGEYRMIDLSGRQELTRINIQAFFTNIDGSVLPVRIPPKGIFSVKLMFRRVSD